MLESLHIFFCIFVGLYIRDALKNGACFNVPTRPPYPITHLKAQINSPIKHFTPYTTLSLTK